MSVQARRGGFYRFYQQNLEIHLARDLAKIIEEYLSPVVGAGKCIWADCQATSFSVFPTGNVAFLQDNGVRLFDKGWEDPCPLQDNDQDGKESLLLPSYFTNISYGRSRTLVVWHHKLFGIRYLGQQMIGIAAWWREVEDICRTPKGNAAFMDSQGNVKFFKPTGYSFKQWKVDLPEFAKEGKGFRFAVLSRNRLALASSESEYMVIYRRKGKKATFIRWRDHQGFVQIFYHKRKEKIMLFDRVEQVVCYFDLSGNHLYDLRLGYRPGPEHGFEPDPGPACIEQVSIAENKIVLLARTQEGKADAIAATIVM